MSQDNAAGDGSTSKELEHRNDDKTQESIVASVTNGDPESDKLVKSWLEDKSQEIQENLEKTQQDKRYQRWMFGLCYLLAMGVCGIVLVALGSTLSDLAGQCNTTATAVGAVFITRGCGAIAGAIASYKLYETFDGNHVISTAILVLSGILLIMPFIFEVWQLHVAFGCLGFCTAVTDTGCQIMTRLVHRKDAGPWLGANTVSFGISGALVPLIAYVTGALIIQYWCLASIGIVAAAILLNLGAARIDRPTANGQASQHAGAGHQTWRDFKTEIIVSAMVFCLIGGKVGATAYLESYVDDTGVIPAGQAELLIMVLWIFITLGRILGVVDQTFITTPLLYTHLAIFLCGGVVAIGLILGVPASRVALWIGISAYGFFNGPTVGYCYDLVNRLTVPSEKGMSIVMFGLNFGASLIPWALSEIWDEGGGYLTLPITMLISMFLPLPLLYLTTLFKNESMPYEAVPTSEPEGTHVESQA